jgi:hypothetical protein
MSEYLTTDYTQPAVTIYCFVSLIHSIAWLAVIQAVLHPVPLISDPAKLQLFTSSVANSNRYAIVLYFGMCIVSFWYPMTAMILMTISWVLWIVTSIILYPKEQIEKDIKNQS